MNFPYFSKNGKLLPVNEAVISVFNIEYAYGFGVYENVRVQDLLPYFLSDHVDRLLYSAQVIGLEHTLSKDSIARAVTELVEAISADPPSQGGSRGVLAQSSDTSLSARGGSALGGERRGDQTTYNLKILLIGAKEPSGVQLFILPLAPLFPDKKLYQKGGAATAIEYERFLPAAKTLNMLPSYYYYTQGRAKGYYDVLFMDKQHNILEGSRTNFFVIKNKTIYTAPSEKVLEGVTKKYILQVARENGYKIVEQDIPLARIGEYDGAFLTSTSSKIVPLNKIDASETSLPVLSSAEERRSRRPLSLAKERAGRGFEFATIAPAIKDLMKYFDTFLKEYRS